MRRLALLGLASAGVYALGITARYPLMAGLQEPRGTWATLVGVSWGALGAHIGVYAALTILYMLALGAVLVARETKHMLSVIVGAWLLSSLLLLGAYPGGESHDIFDYTFRGRMMAERGVSPLAITPDRFSRAPYYLYISWHRHVDTYGPLWEYASASVAAAVQAVLRAAGLWYSDPRTCPQSAQSCAMLAGYVTGYRLLAIGLAGLTGALVFTTVRRTWPDDANAALLAWLWNPVLLVGTALGAHNDALLLALLAAALSLFGRRRWVLGLLALALAAHVKLTALLLAPVLGAWLLRQIGWRRALGRSLTALAIVAPLSWLLYAPLGGWATLPRMLEERALFLAASPANVVYRWLYDTQGWGAPGARNVVQQTVTLLFAAVALALLVRMLWAAPPDGEHTLWKGAAAITLAYLFVGSFWFQHWYVLWALAPAALLPRSTTVRVILPWYGFGALCANVATNMLGVLITPELSRLTLAVAEVSLILGPLALATLCYTGRAWVSRQLRTRHAVGFLPANKRVGTRENS